MLMKDTRKFVDQYYTLLDTDRTKLLRSLIKPDTIVSWNGNPLTSAMYESLVLEQLSRSQHRVSSFDCHPLTAQMFGVAQQPASGTAAQGVIVSINGTVKFGNDRVRQFQQTFLLRSEQQSNSLYVATDTYRFVE